MEKVEIFLSDEASINIARRGDGVVLTISGYDVISNVESSIRGVLPTPITRGRSPVRGISTTSLERGARLSPRRVMPPSPPASTRRDQSPQRTQVIIMLHSDGEGKLEDVFGSVEKDIENFGMRILDADLYSKIAGHVEVDADSEAARAFVRSNANGRQYRTEYGEIVDVYFSTYS